MKKRLLLIGFILLLAACGDDVVEENTESSDREEVEVTTEDDMNSEDPQEEEFDIVLPTDQEIMLHKLLNLIDEGLAFDTGSYIKGDIPAGEYAFISFDGSGSYYVEEDAAGSILDNENFNSFGYVHVHEAGNLETRGALVQVEALDQLDVTGAKELYEVLNGVEDYSDSGWYKVGADIEPGKYVLESYGSGYVAVMSGPVGNSDILTNDNFDGRYSVHLQEGEYLTISRATIAE